MLTNCIFLNAPVRTILTEADSKIFLTREVNKLTRLERLFFSIKNNTPNTDQNTSPQSGDEYEHLRQMLNHCKEQQLLDFDATYCGALHRNGLDLLRLNDIMSNFYQRRLTFNYLELSLESYFATHSCPEPDDRCFAQAENPQQIYRLWQHLFPETAISGIYSEEYFAQAVQKKHIITVSADEVRALNGEQQTACDHGPALAGAVIAAVSDQRIHVKALFKNPDCKIRGVLPALICRTCSVARQKKLRSVFLYHNSAQEYLARLYQAQGFCNNHNFDWSYYFSSND